MPACSKIPAPLPGDPTGLGPVSYTFAFSDTVGSQDLGVENILVNHDLNGNHACYLAFVPRFSVVYLVNDAGTALSPGASLAASSMLSNSQCTVTWGSNPVTASGNNLTLQFSIAFSAAFGPNLVVYVAARDVNEGNNTDWHAMGTASAQ